MARMGGRKRSELMSRVRTRNTSPEIKVQELLDKFNIEYQTHVSDLDGEPDIVISDHKLVVFVHGCFWHQHPNCDSAKRPESNTEFWNAKLDRNMERDKRQLESLKASGWNVMVIWECEIEAEFEQVAKKIRGKVAFEGK